MQKVSVSTVKGEISHVKVRMHVEFMLLTAFIICYGQLLLLSLSWYILVLADWSSFFLLIFYTSVKSV